LGNENSNRRRFLRKLAKLVAAGGVATLLLERLGGKPLIPPVQAVDMAIDATNYGTGTTKLESSVSSGEAFRVDATASSGSTYGVYGRTASSDGWGVVGFASAGTGGTKGVFGQSNSTSGTAVDGYAYALSGFTRGVYAHTDSADGTGVYGSGGRRGVEGYAWAASGISVLGMAGNAGARPIVAKGYSGQTANLQEWQNSAGTPLSVVDAAGKLGVGIAAPARQVHLQGNNAVFRMDRDVNSSAFILVRTAPGDFNTVWKTFYVGVDASGVNNGSFFIGDVGTAVSGPSTKRLLIDNAGNVGVGTETPSEKLHVVGKVRATQGFITGDITFANSFKVTENDEAGLAFLNNTGEKIAVLDRKGNLHIKGEVIKDL